MIEKILELLKEMKPGFDFTGRTDLVDSGDFDSFDVISLVSEMNEAFQIDVPVEEIVPENFNSLEAIKALAERLLEE